MARCRDTPRRSHGHGRGRIPGGSREGNARFADVQSVKRTEFYAAKQIGIDLAITVKVRYGDYGNQERLLFRGKEYKVERAYTDAREFYTLECSEFKEASA